ncbi:MAG: cytidine deaminase [Bacteroidia bacterium]|nr:cytidine deaminase [Bacteroidia bacterium]
MQRLWRVTYEELHEDTLSAPEKELIQAAAKAAEHAYAPYSKFHVGAAVRLRDGRIYTGNNQENAAYPSGLCAERTLLFSLGAQSLISSVEILAVYSPHSLSPVMPCGACRQVMHEYQEKSQNRWVLLFAGASSLVYRFVGVESLLPFAFVWRPA